MNIGRGLRVPPVFPVLTKARVMGGFLVLFVAIAISLLVALMSAGQDVSQTAFVGDHPTAQAVAANMIEFHRAAVDFVSRTQNRNPTTLSWSWSYTTQTTVRCSASYAGGTYDTSGNATSPDCTGDTSEFRVPGFSVNIYNWKAYYRSDGAGGSDDIVVTYANASTDVLAGYSSQAIASALNEFGLAGETDWYWGVTPGSGGITLSNGTATLTMPTGFSKRNVVAIATIIP